MWRRLKDRSNLKAFKTVALALIGLTLMGSSVGECNVHDRFELGVLAQEHSAPIWSKDGSKIVFAHPPSGVFVVEVDGSRMWSLPQDSRLGTSADPGNFSPSLSPDGTRVAYAAISRSGNSSDIVTSALDGSDLRRLTRHSAIDAYPVWSPDGTQILFYSRRASSPGNPTLSLFIMDSDGSNLRELSPESSKAIGKFPPVWSQDGERIAFVVYGISGGYSVNTIRADGSELTELGEAASSPAWSPDGSRLAFVEEGKETRRLVIMDPDGGDLREVWSFPSDQVWYDNVSWSPDGSEILLGGLSSEAGTLGILPVYVVEIDETGSGRAAEPRGVGFGAAAWSPDGSRIAFHASGESSDAPLFTKARDGSDLQVLVRGDYERLVAVFSDWRDVTGDIAACSNGKVVSNPGKNPGLVRDCETLLGLRDTLAGDAILNWSGDAEISDWEGIMVDGSPPRVKGLGFGALHPSPLSGVIPPALSNLTSLESLSLTGSRYSRLRGEIPPELGSLTNLWRLHLSSNDLTGNIPPELGRLTNLIELGLQENELSGSIPPQLGNLSNLEYLWLWSNRLTGPVPPELERLTNLRSFGISGNPLTGCVPIALYGRMTSSGPWELESC